MVVPVLCNKAVSSLIMLYTTIIKSSPPQSLSLLDTMAAIALSVPLARMTSSKTTIAIKDHQRNNAANKRRGEYPPPSQLDHR